jgi:hypothetical protein
MKKTYEQLNLETVDVLNRIKARINSETDIVWTRFNSVEELMNTLNDYIVRINSSDKSVYGDLKNEFLPTSSLQELSISNGWGKDFLDIAELFDEIHFNIRQYL